MGSMSGLLTPAEELTQRAKRLLATFQSADRTLTRREVRVHAVVDSGCNAPAWSDGVDVSFNFATMVASDFLTAEGIVATTGLNYHELAHVIYTPPSSTYFRTRIKDDGLFQTWNILEDQRIERLLCGRWLAVSPFLTAVFLRYCLENQADADRVYPLAVGRRHLPLKVRQYLRNCFAAPAYADRIERIVNDYLAIRHKDEAENDRAYKLVDELHDIFLAITPPPDFNGHSERPQVVTGQVAEEPNAKVEADGAAADKAEADGQLDPTGSGEGQGEDGDKDNEGSADGEGGDGASGSGSGGKKKDETLDDVAKKALKDLGKRQDVQEAVKESIDVQTGVSGVLQSSLPLRKITAWLDITQEAASAAHQFSDELRVIVDAAAPGWEARQSSGRLNMRRAMNREFDIDTVFDRWNPGEVDVFSIEAVVVVDESKSMRNGEKKERASIGTWIIRRGIELVDGEAMTTVLGYDDQKHETLAQRGDSAGIHKIPLFRAGGGTKPGVCLNEARRIFAGSTKAHKVLFLLTDGQFDSTDVTPMPDGSIAMMNRAGITTVLFFIGHPGQDYANHGCKIHRGIVDEFDYVAGVRDVVTELMRGGSGV